MAAYLSPVFGAGAQLFNNQGIVLSGGKIYTYQAGTTTPLGTWTDSTQTITNANPIILDSAGRLSSEIWLQAGSTYKFILTDSADNVLGTWDNIAGLNDITTSVTVAEWTATNLTPAYISGTSFSVPGNNTATFVINRRVKIVVSAGTVYGYVYSSSFGGGVTTVVIQPDSTTLDSGISSVSVGLLDSTNISVPQQYMAANAPVVLTAASTTNIGAALSTTITINGVTTITAFDTVLAGIIRFINWNAATPITYNVTNMQLIGSVSRTNNAGDFSVFRSLGSGNWAEEVYQQHTGNISANAATASLATALQSGATAVTQAGQDNSTKIATDQYVDRQHESQVFTTSGTWTKPSWLMPTGLVWVEVWGGGGGTGAGAFAGAGGGAYNSRIFLASDLGATETVTIGAGGTPSTWNGGNSSFGTKVLAYGGGGSISTTGGGGGGTLTAGALTTPGTGYGPAGGFDAGGAAGVNTIWGGAGGSTAASGNGASSLFGGGGGAGAVSGTGGASCYGGAGGNAGTDGNAPGGGAGGKGVTGATGARGEVRVRVL